MPLKKRTKKNTRTILAIDTSSKVLALALAQNGKVLWELNTMDQFRHIEELIPRIREGLRVVGWKMSDLTHIACGRGPGSFTGLRVGLATVKGLACAGDQHVVGCSSLDVIAQNLPAECTGMVILDARREKMYTAHYVWDGARHVRRGKERAESLKDVCAYLVKQKHTMAITGDGVRVYGDALHASAHENVYMLPEEKWYPHARHVVLCALHEIADKKYLPVSAVVPQYLRLSEAEEKRKELNKGRRVS